MATDNGFDGGPLSGGSFAQMLESGDVGPFIEEVLIYPSSLPDETRSKMLRFGDDGRNEEVMGFFEAGAVAQKSGISGGDSSSTSSSSGCSFSKSRKAKSGEGSMEEKRRVGSGPDSVLKSGTGSGSRASAENGGETPKKHKTEVKKEKLGERITALQKLVSPYGKTDTASVLHEAMGYIRFLHDQVQVLSSPYLQRLPSSAHLQEGGEAVSKYGLRSRGLCLVPVESTVHVAKSNGADFWSTAMGSHPSTH
ncbi:transcription factor bHLH154-like isoform X2 [Magnolia sinica]|uniref:transcription factor bHLH154-like isoform X2 n=1 Tax=Magnolia sinica TaxID=86752 RepID=UPI002657D915|nr:transcription factor bHLH154-like isoform X2 [Magnolia sinica]